MKASIRLESMAVPQRAWFSLALACLASLSCGGPASGDAPHSARSPGEAVERGALNRDDACPAPHGLTIDGVTRFALGTNWAWRQFAGDFGGIAAWNVPGVAQGAGNYQLDLAAMAAKKVNVVRWWLFPRLQSSGITMGADDVPQSIGGTLVADLTKALELAEQNDVYLMLTLFSFDNFRPTKDENGVHSVGLQPIVVDAGKRARLLKNLVEPVADAVASSPYAKRALAWDIINEPEWAMAGFNKYQTGAFLPQSGMQTVTHDQMETFVIETAAVLHAHSRAPVTVGSAAINWGRAWIHSNLDFYQLHYYDWVYEWFPYKQVTLQQVGLTDKPVLLGEFPNAGLSAVGWRSLPARTAAQFAQDLWEGGYAGALSWAYNDPAFPWTAYGLEPFQRAHACETRF